MNFAARDGTRGNRIVLAFRSAVTRDGGNFVERNIRLFGDGPGAAQGGRMCEPLFAPLAPVDGHHVEFGKLEERGDGGTWITGCGNRTGIRGVLETPRPEVGECGYDDEYPRVTPQGRVA